MRLEERLRDREAWPGGERAAAARTLEVLSTRTVFAVVRECFYGTSRFDAFVTRVGASAPAISRALRQLEAEGIVVRVPYREPDSRARDEYRLTEAGEDLLPVVLALSQWADKHRQHGRALLGFYRISDDRRVGVSVTTADTPSVRSDEIEVRAEGQQTSTRRRRRPREESSEQRFQ